MQLRLKTFFFFFLGVLVFWFLYIERAILTPFILGGVFAYLVNPIVDFFTHKIKLPRVLSILIIYICIVGIVGFAISTIVRRVGFESQDLQSYVLNFIFSAKQQIGLLPDWVRPFATDTIASLQKSRIFTTQYFLLLFPEAISRIVSFIIFLFSGFYFLKDGRSFIDKILNVIPKKYRIDVEILIRKINAVLSGYLRGQMFLVVFVSTVLFIGLTIVGVRFALVLAIFSGFAEIVPVIGPIVATAVAALVVLSTGTLNLSLTSVQGALIVALFYFVVRQIQDYFVTPFVMQRVTNLHPLIILFSVLAGGHLWGILGLILAVPIAATIKILLEFSSEIIRNQD